MTRSFPDAGVLVAATRTDPLLSEPAIRLLDDPTRQLLTSRFVQLESRPKAAYYRRGLEYRFYQTFFEDRRVEWCDDYAEMLQLAQREADERGLAALDALHVAAAHLLRADEFVTVERPERVIHRTRLVPVRYLYAVLPRP